MDDAARICARLIRDGFARREELPALGHVELRRDVERRLGEVGLSLATSAYSEHVGLRLSDAAVAEPDFEAATNLGLRADALALLAIAWTRLALPKRTVRDTRETPGQALLLPEDRTDAARRFAPTLRIGTLAREFRKALGSRSNIQRLVTQLRRFGFLAGRGETIEAGPLLELAIDGERMTAWIRREVLARLLAEPEAPSEAEPPSLEDQLLAVLVRFSEPVPIRRLSDETGKPREQVRKLLKSLERDGRVRRVGERAQTCWEAVR